MTVPLREAVGAHRVIEPVGALPQAARRLDNDFTSLHPSELLLDVHSLNLDAASYRQISEAAGGDAERVKATVLETVAASGKQHNPVTGSGGMLLGRVAKIGADHPRYGQLGVGESVASLISLTLTPLRIDAITDLHPQAAQLTVLGQAVLFASSPLAVVPQDLSASAALALFDVCGAPMQVSRLCSGGDSVLVLGGGGKSGVLAVAEARRQCGPEGRVVAVESAPGYAAQLQGLSLCEVVSADATDPLAVLDALAAAGCPDTYDGVVSCVSVAGAEMTAVLACRPRGRVLFFAMTTSFTRAALGAEGAGKDIDLLIGNGYATGHADYALDLLRSTPGLLPLFEERYGS